MPRALLVITATLFAAVSLAMILGGIGVLGDDGDEANQASANQTIVDEDLLPDVAGIYHTCLNEPFEAVEEEIDDPQIHNYYLRNN